MSDKILRGEVFSEIDSADREFWEADGTAEGALAPPAEPAEGS
jgi:hypothetical protein